MSLTLAQVHQQSPSELASASPSELMQLQVEAANALASAKSLKERVDGAIAVKFEQRASALRQQQGKDTGSVHFEDQGIRITAVLPKKPEWDQKQLAVLAKRIAAAGDDPSEYIDISYKVPERKYTAWPETLRTTFANARTLKTGKPTYRLQPIEEK